MMVSTKGRYALRVMVDLAERDNAAYIPLKEIAARQEISHKYLENIMRALSKAGFVDAAQGKGGGYRLNRDPSGYTVAAVLAVTEGTLSPVACLEKTDNACARAADCKTLPLWTELNRVINRYLESVTIADLANNASAGDYVI